MVQEEVDIRLDKSLVGNWRGANLYVFGKEVKKISCKTLIHGSNWNFWEYLSSQEYYNDLIAMKDVGFNALRTFLIKLKLHSEEEKERFWKAVSYSRLQFLPALFNWKTIDYFSWDAQKAWMDYCLAKIQEYELPIIAIDLCNEPDLGKVATIKHLKRLHEYVTKNTRCEYPITIGFRCKSILVVPEKVKELDELCDMHTPHYYANPFLHIGEHPVVYFDVWLKKWQDFRKPMIIGEWGFETPYFLEGVQEVYMSQMLAKFNHQAIHPRKHAEFKGHCVWDWRDAIKGKDYWGIVHLDLTAKKCLDLFRR